MPPLACTENEEPATSTHESRAPAVIELDALPVP
jgi:hypothetical protein